MRIPEDLSTETLKRLCDFHVQHFKKLLELGASDKPAARTVNLVECDHYLGVWQRGATALEIGAVVPSDCVHEIQDAMWSGDADLHLTPKELEAWAKYQAEQESDV